MQTSFRLPMLVTVAMVILVSSCSKKTNTEGRFIPKNASLAFLMDGASLSSKLPWEEMRQTELFKEIYADTSVASYMKTAMENPGNTGIELKKNILFFVQKDSLGIYMAIEGMIKDAAKFKLYNNTVYKGAAESEKDGIHFLSKGKGLTSWDKDKFVILVDVPEFRLSRSYGMTADTTISKRDLAAAARTIYNLPSDNSLGNDEKFSGLVNSKGDVHFWINAGELASNTAGMAALSMMNINRLYEGTVVTGSATFENGRIDIDTKSYYSQEMNDLLKKYSEGKVNMDMIKRIPAKDISALFALNFQPDGLREFLKVSGLEGFVNLGAVKYGFTADDFIKANKGDIVLAASDMKRDSSNSMHPDILFATAIGDKNAFGKITDAGNKLDKEMGNPSDIVHNKNENYFAIGTKRQSVDQYIAASANNNFSFLNKISGSSSAFYLNFQSLMSGMGEGFTRDSLNMILFQASAKMWDNMLATGGGFKDGGAVQHIEINLVDKNTNSLKQLNTYMATLTRIQREKKAITDKMMNDVSEREYSDSLMSGADAVQ